MLLFTNALPTSCFFPPEFGCAFPSIVFASNSRCAWHSHHMAAVERGYSLLFSKGSFYGCSGFARRCKGFHSGGSFPLEAEILEFMESSRNPEAFPSKKDLIQGGRVDLVDAIVNEGGWLCLGWNLDEQQNGGYLEEISDRFGEINNFKIYERQRFPPSSSFTGRSLETVSEHESGIEGMLCRLEKERNATFLTGKEHLHSETTAKETVAGLQGSTISMPLTAKEGKGNDFGDYLSQNSSPIQINGLGGLVNSAVQRIWSTFKTDLQDGDFKDSEIALSEGRSRELLDVPRYETLGSREDPTNSNSCKEEMTLSQLQHHLQNLKLEVSSAIGSLRSNAFAYEKELSDAFEFQENEILNVKDKLRSTRAKLAVVEGKMALTIIGAQKAIEEKQKRINCARRALQFLRTACVFWPSSAAEVLLVGSFDAWSTQRKMEKSSTGVFSLFLKLYPGKYEIKFIADGQWKIDPLRPIVYNNGYENNLLIIT